MPRRSQRSPRCQAGGSSGRAWWRCRKPEAPSTRERDAGAGSRPAVPPWLRTSFGMGEVLRPSDSHASVRNGTHRAWEAPPAQRPETPHPGGSMSLPSRQKAGTRVVLVLVHWCTGCTIVPSIVSTARTGALVAHTLPLTLQVHGLHSDWRTLVSAERPLLRPMRVGLGGLPTKSRLCRSGEWPY